MSEYRSVIVGSGSCLPSRVVSNEELVEHLDTSDEWIRQRTGIERRHIISEGECTSTLGTSAARAALEDGAVEPSEVDLIILATTTPDRTVPATSVTVQKCLGIRSGFAFDIQAVCCGFLYALSTADQFIRSGGARCALVIGAETYSRILDWDDRGTCILFGDGAGAVVLRGENGGNGRGILSCHLRSDGRYDDILYTDGGPSSTGTVGRLRMNGREVFRHAVTHMSEIMVHALKEGDVTPDEVDWVVLHQANTRIVDAVRERVGLDKKKTIVTIQDHANTSAASIPLVLDTATRDGRIKKGDLLLLSAVGGGLSWGASLVRW